jgi:exo-1,4-beta-D-glucosaminidase
MLDQYTTTLSTRFGAPVNVEDFLAMSQLTTYEGERAMFEAYRRNAYTSTGVIQWMLNNSWPSLIWHLYDYYLVPAGGYFGTKKAMEPVHVQYGYDDHSVAVVNDTRNAVPRVKVSATLYNLDATQAATHGGTLDLAPDSSSKVLDLPLPDKISTTYFLKLKLQDAQGKLLSDNFYWLSTKADTLDWAKRKDTVYTPQKDFADLTGLNSLPQVSLSVHASKTTAGGEDKITVTAKNPSSSIAFMAHLRLTRGLGGEDVVPIFWSDNYFSLLPGEERQVTATYDSSALDGKAAVLAVDGYNVVSSTVQLASIQVTNAN